MCSIFYPGEIVLENASCYRVIALHTRRSVCVLPNTVLPGKPRTLLLVTHITAIANSVFQCSHGSLILEGIDSRCNLYSVTTGWTLFHCLFSFGERTMRTMVQHFYVRQRKVQHYINIVIEYGHFRLKITGISSLTLSQCESSPCIELYL